MNANILRMPAEAVSRPVPDRDEIERSLKLFITLGSVVEIRGLEVTRQDFKRPHAEYGYFDSLDKATSAALKLGRTDGSFLPPLCAIELASEKIANGVCNL